MHANFSLFVAGATAVAIQPVQVLPTVRIKEFHGRMQANEEIIRTEKPKNERHLRWLCYNDMIPTNFLV